LYLADDSKTLVAKYHRPHTGFLSKSGPTPASLEIFPHHQSGGYDQATIDLILTTFLYLEKKRDDEEKSRNAAAAANSAAGASAAAAA
jgi:uncharacterized protein with ParB-like and HNH nuclease domain